MKIFKAHSPGIPQTNQVEIILYAKFNPGNTAIKEIRIKARFSFAKLKFFIQEKKGAKAI